MSATAVFVVVQAGIAVASIAVSWATWPTRRGWVPYRVGAAFAFLMAAWYAVNAALNVFHLLWWRGMTVAGIVLYAIPLLAMSAWLVSYALTRRSARRPS